MWVTVATSKGMEYKEADNNYRCRIFEFPPESQYAGKRFAHPRKLIVDLAYGVYGLKVADTWEFHVTDGDKGEIRVADIGLEQLLKEFGEEAFLIE